MFRSVFFFPLLLAVLLTLTACGTIRPMQLEPEALEDQALVFGVISRIEDLREYTGQALFLRPLDSEMPGVQLTASDSSSRAPGVDTVEDGLEHFVIAKLVPAGEYEVEKLNAYLVAGYSTTIWSHEFKVPPRFTVEAGKAYYLGHHAVVPRVDEIIFGHQIPHEPYFVSMNNVERDSELAREVYPNLPPVKLVEGITDIPFDAKKVFDLAREINPDLERWESSSE